MVLDSVILYNPTFQHFYFSKKVTNTDLLPIDDAIISFKSAFDKINDLLKPSTFIDIWN